MKEPNPLVYYPIFLNLEGKKCVVVGGGEVALRKVRALLDSGAKVVVVSPTLNSDLAQLAEVETISLISREYEPKDLKDAVIVVAATDIAEVNQNIAKKARKHGILVNVVDRPEESDFIMPSLVRRGDLILAVSTSGASPALAKKIRMRLEQTFGEEYSPLLSLIKEVRQELKEQQLRVNTEDWQNALDLDLLTHLIQAGERQKAKAALLEKLKPSREDP
jgi:precorrin-2 dehydrogenase/sirohydrochlorin ferrochelatase